MNSNGTRTVSINGIDGSVLFILDRYKSGGDFFKSTHQFELGLESSRLKTWIKAEVQQKSYRNVSKSLEMLTGESVYSSSQVGEKVKIYAQEVTQHEIKTYDGLQLCLPFSESNIDLYDSQTQEVHLFDDGIGVKKQKKSRVIGYEKRQKTVRTDLIEIQKPSGGFDYLTAGYGVKNWDIETAVVCWISLNYGNIRLPLVAITDGARNIRLRLWRIFGGQVIIILDWYHLQKKVRELCSMIAFGKKQKEGMLTFISPLLWEGKVDEAVEYLKKINPRNIKKHEEIVEYLLKHKSEIINYKKRKEAKKTIGSGRAEKGVDLVVAQRKKNKPIAWSKDGSHALSVLRANELNITMAA